jgi:uncharacterized protein
MNELLLELQEEFRDKMLSFTGGTIREAKFIDMPNKIRVAIGMRRTGKTYLLLQKIHSLLQAGVPITRILYINFEDERLLPMQQKDFGRLVDSFYTLYPENHKNLCYLFFDEIQNVEGWHLVIRRFFDSKNVELYLTGSSAKLLSKEINSSLRGRSLATEVWPFSFSEFLTANNIKHPETKLLSKQSLDVYKKHLNKYLFVGGFPEINDLWDAEETQSVHTELLQNYVSVVLLRDIIERYNLKNSLIVRYMTYGLLKNVGSGFSINKLYNDLKSQTGSDLPVSKATLHQYLAYVEDAYLAFAVPIYAESLRKTQSNLRKIYAIDTGLVRACTRRFADNIGHHFENLVYLDLRRRKHEIYYYLTETRREVDFLSKDIMGNWYLYQVCWNMDHPKTMERETLALLEAEAELKLKGIDVKGEIITPDSYMRFALNS